MSLNKEGWYSKNRFMVHRLLASIGWIGNYKGLEKVLPILSFCPNQRHQWVSSACIYEQQKEKSKWRKLLDSSQISGNHGPKPALNTSYLTHERHLLTVMHFLLVIELYFDWNGDNLLLSSLFSIFIVAPLQWKELGIDRDRVASWSELHNKKPFEISLLFYLFVHIAWKIQWEMENYNFFQ